VGEFSAPVGGEGRGGEGGGGGVDGSVQWWQWWWEGRHTSTPRRYSRRVAVLNA